MHKNLPSFYIFTDKSYSSIFKNNNTNIGIIYRNYNNFNKEIELKKIAKHCKKKRYQLFVSNDSKLALKVRAQGVYLPAFNKTKRLSNLENKKLIVLGSAHNQKEIHQKITQKCKAIFLSPAFPIKKTKRFLNIYKFNFLSQFNKVNIFALGGINSNNIKKLKLLNINGFGGIRIGKKKPAFLRPVFLKN